MNRDMGTCIGCSHLMIEGEWAGQHHVGSDIVCIWEETATMRRKRLTRSVMEGIKKSPWAYYIPTIAAGFATRGVPGTCPRMERHRVIEKLREL